MMFYTLHTIAYQKRTGLLALSPQINEQDEDKYFNRHANGDPAKLILPPYELLPRVPYSDILSAANPFSYIGIFVSAKFKDCVSGLKTPPLYFYPVKVTDSEGKEVKNIFYMYAYIPNSFTDYANSTFTMIKVVEELGEFKVDSDEALFAKRREVLKDGMFIEAKHIVMNDKYDNFDLFFLKHTSIPDYIVSERGKFVLESAGLTGVDFIAEPIIKVL